MKIPQITTPWKGALAVLGLTILWSLFQAHVDGNWTFNDIDDWAKFKEVMELYAWTCLPVVAGWIGWQSPFRQDTAPVTTTAPVDMPEKK